MTIIDIEAGIDEAEQDFYVIERNSAGEAWNVLDSAYEEYSGTWTNWITHLPEVGTTGYYGPTNFIGTGEGRWAQIYKRLGGSPDRTDDLYKTIYEEQEIDFPEEHEVLDKLDSMIQTDEDEDYGYQFTENALEFAPSGDINTGGGFLYARVSTNSIASRKGYLEIIQGEEKVITFIVEADGTFDVQSFDSITVRIADPSDNLITINDDDIERVTEELDIQVFRATFPANETLTLVEGIARIEIVFDTQKVQLKQAIKITQSLSNL